ncbi:MAG: hypothetical protein WD607_05770 [Candidatus Paceibacterota bacterium]
MSMISIDIDTIFNPDIPYKEKLQIVFNYQFEHSPVYSSFLKTLELKKGSVIDPETVPLLPIKAFKYTPIVCGDKEPQLVFKSSGTTNMDRSTHYISDPEYYRRAIETEFYKYFPANRYALLYHMPGYQKNSDSSLIWMANHLIERDTDSLNRFLPENRTELFNWFKRVYDKKKKVLLFGAAFGLLDLIDHNRITFPEPIEIIETGGMKTFRRDMSKKELRIQLAKGFGLEQKFIHSEYGMCELLSQMYSIGSEWFKAPDWVYVTIRKSDNPTVPCEPGMEGKIGIIDLANLHSCSFILTEDRGIKNESGLFKVLGRWSNQNLRGCNFLIDEE